MKRGAFSLFFILAASARARRCALQTERNGGFGFQTKMKDRFLNQRKLVAKERPVGRMSLEPCTRFVWIAFQVPLSLFAMAFVPLCSFVILFQVPLGLFAILFVQLGSFTIMFCPTWFVRDRVPGPPRFVCDRVFPLGSFVIAFQVPLQICLHLSLSVCM